MRYQNRTSESEIEIREKPDGDKIISSPHNTDAVYTRKEKQTVVGHKGFVTETCDSNNGVQFITDVNFESATHADAREIFAIEQRLADNNLVPETLYGDAGFIDADHPFDIANFQVSVDGKNGELAVLACPAGQMANDQHRSEKTGKVLVHFKRDFCVSCTSRERYQVRVGGRTATLTVYEAQYAGAARHHEYMGNVEYRKECGIRAGAESLMNEIANLHNGRQSRHRNEKGLRLQLVFAGISCNVKRFIRYTQTCDKTPVNAVE